MARWIAFDSEIAEELRRQSPPNTVVVKAGSALQAALDDPSDSVVVLPGADADSAVLVRVHRNCPSPGTVHYEATGFLGLSDEPVYEDEIEPGTKKPWWKRVF